MLFTDQEIKDLTLKYKNGLTMNQLAELFTDNGERMSVHTVKKYVQHGFIPNCKRVGSKGKHKGSYGIFPASAIERINTIKKVTSGCSDSLEDLRYSYLTSTTHVLKAIDEMDNAASVMFRGELRLPKGFTGALKQLRGVVDDLKIKERRYL